jgi:hypothetical protein
MEAEEGMVKYWLEPNSTTISWACSDVNYFLTNEIKRLQNNFKWYEWYMPNFNKGSEILWYSSANECDLDILVHFQQIK